MPECVLARLLLHWVRFGAVIFKYVRSTAPGAALARPENAGHEQVGELLDRLRSEGHSYETVETSTMSDAERRELYSRAAAGVGSKYRTARVFGSNEHRGEDFGTGTPALLTYEGKDDEFPVDVHPHEFKDGRQVTIAQYLSSLLDDTPGA